MYLKASTVKPRFKSWVTFLQTEVLSAPRGHVHCGTEASLCRIPWPFLSVMFHGLSSTCCLKLGFTYLTLGHLQQVAGAAAPWGLSKMFENEE